MTNSTSHPQSTYLAPESILPLTCSRTGTCCHGKTVWLNPWELACLACAKGVSSLEFRNVYCEFGGIRLKFDGEPGWKGLLACSMYNPSTGCIVHAGRPLACRLFPLGREIMGATVRYLHRGSEFPCLDGCSEVVSLPHLTVAEYLAGQQVAAGEAAQDAYLELMQHLADGAFALLLETGLAATGDRQTLRLWRKLGNDTPEELAAYLGSEWIDHLMLPKIEGSLDDPVAFSRLHHDLLQNEAQKAFGSLTTTDAVSSASGLMIGLALHLARGLGADPAKLAELWIATAKENGARE